MLPYLVLVAHELHDDADVLVEVLGGDDAHDIGVVGGVGILAARVHHEGRRRPTSAATDDEQLQTNDEQLQQTTNNCDRRRTAATDDEYVRMRAVIADTPATSWSLRCHAGFGHLIVTN